MASGTNTGTDHEIIKMRVLSLFALITTLIVGFLTPYLMLYDSTPPPDPQPPGYSSCIGLYLNGMAPYGFGLILEQYSLNGLNQSNSLLFWILTLIVALQFLFLAPRMKRLLLHITVLCFSLLAWIFGAYSIYGQLSGWVIVPTPITPVVALFALLLIWFSSKK